MFWIIQSNVVRDMLYERMIDACIEGLIARLVVE